MKPNTQKLYELVIEGNDLFIEVEPSISTSVGLMDKALRKKGINADAITVDAIKSKNRLIFVLLDNDTSTVGVGLGNTLKNDINLVEQIALADLSPKVISQKLVSYLK